MTHLEEDGRPHTRINAFPRGSLGDPVWQHLPWRAARPEMTDDLRRATMQPPRNGSL